MRTIAHISDLHFGMTEPRIVEAAVQDLSERRPTVLVVSGDLTQRARAPQFRDAAAFLRRLPSPQVIVPGNHDIPLYDVFTRFFASLRNFKKIITPNLWPVYRDEELLVIGINTARAFTFTINGFWKDGRISVAQLEEIERLARKESEKTMTVVVTHHPFIPPPGRRIHGIVHGTGAALRTMEKSGVDLLLAGHLHLGYAGDVRTHHEGVRRSILSVQAASVTSTRRRGEPNAYNWITLEPDLITIEARGFDGNRFMTAEIARFRRVEGVWKKE
jgi:3',5'-cyclic AMP phosphodiesterase CpdA